MNGPVYIGIDLGTQSVRAMAVDPEGNVVASASHPLQSRREGVRHEQDPALWWSATIACLRSVTRDLVGASTIEGVAIDSTSGTILLVDAECRALTPGLMYDDGRASQESARVQEAGAEVWSGIGYRMQTSWALPKLLWLLRSDPALRNARLFHQNDFIHARLAGHALATDSSHSLKTGYDLVRSQWPYAVMEMLEIPAVMLPNVVTPGTRIGEVGGLASDETGLPAGTPIFAGMTDGCASQISAGATRIGDWNAVIGTTLVLKGATRERLHDPLGTVYSHRLSEELWLPGGASSTGAAAIAARFAVADLPHLNERAALAGPSSRVIYPLVGQGERFPFAAPEARAFSLGDEGTVEQSYRAVLEGIAMIERLAFDRLEQLGAPTGGRFTISGGAVKSEALNQIRSDMLERELWVPAVAEAAFGMALLAAASQSSLEECTARMVRYQKSYSPRLSFESYAEQYRTLVEELYRRGWLPEALRVAAMAGLHA